MYSEILGAEMDKIYFVLGFTLFWTVAIVVAGIVLTYVYHAVKTVPMAIDFFRWYRFYAIQHDPNWKSHVGIVHNYIAAFISVWSYDKNTTITHHAGMVYKPYAWK